MKVQQCRSAEVRAKNITNDSVTINEHEIAALSNWYRNV
jgi:hypothetical protein